MSESIITQLRRIEHLAYETISERDRLRHQHIRCAALARMMADEWQRWIDTEDEMPSEAFLDTLADLIQAHGVKLDLKIDP